MPLENAFDADAPVGETLERLLPPELLAGLSGECRALADRLPDLERAARAAEDEPPRQAHGRPEVSAGWSRLLEVAARWGLASIPAEQRLGPWARLHQVALLQLFAPASAGAWHLVAQSDAVAGALLRFDPALAARAVPMLASRDPARRWTGAVWIPERGAEGLSAAPAADGRFALSGRQWPAPVPAAAVLTPARSGRGAPALYYLEPGEAARIERLDERWTARALPIAAVTLDAASAERVGGEEDGPAVLAAALHVTRLHAAAAACGILARLLGRLRGANASPLRRSTVAALQVEHEAALALVVECARVLGRDEQGESTPAERAWLPLLAPLARLMTTRQALAVAAEVAECLGGAAFAEASGVPALQRAAQALTLLEESSDALSLEFLHQARRDDLLETVLEGLRGRVHRLSEGELADLAEPLAAHLEGLAGGYRRTLAAGPFASEAAARRLALSFAAFAAAVPLAEQAAWAGARRRSGRSAAAARRWIATRIPRLPDPALWDLRIEEDALLGAAPEDSSGRG